MKNWPDKTNFLSLFRFFKNHFNKQGFGVWKKHDKFLNLNFRFKKSIIVLSVLFFGIAIGIFALGLFRASHSPSESLVIKTAKTISVAPVAGEKIKWISYVKASSINAEQKYIKLPKGAKNIKVRKITGEELQAIKNKNAQLSLIKRQELVNLPTNKNLVASVFDISKNFLQFGLASAEDAVSQIVGEVVSTPTAVLVDVSSQAAPSSEAAPTSETVSNSASNDSAPANESASQNQTSEESSQTASSSEVAPDSASNDSASTQKTASQNPAGEESAQTLPIENENNDSALNQETGESSEEVADSETSESSEIIQETPTTAEISTEGSAGAVVSDQPPAETTPETTVEQPVETQQTEIINTNLIEDVITATDEEVVAVEYTIEEDTIIIKEQQTKYGKLVTVSYSGDVNNSTPIVETSTSEQEIPFSTTTETEGISNPINPSTETSTEIQPTESVEEKQVQEKAEEKKKEINESIKEEKISEKQNKKEEVSTETTDKIAPTEETSESLVENTTSEESKIPIEASTPEIPITTNTPVVTPTNVLAYTTIPEMYKLDEKDKIQLKWQNNNNQKMDFVVYDLNSNGKIDYIEWTVPHLSDQIFEIIFISKAFRLDSNKNITENIYEYVQVKDNNWVTMNDGEYARVTFDEILDNTKDNTIYARATNSNQPVSIEVYPVYTDADGNQTTGDLVATFKNIGSENTYVVLLTNLQTPTDIFDLKIIGNVDIDWVVDPTFTSTQTGAFNIGTTWGGACASSCTAGVDFPGTTDTAVINSAVTMDSARTVAGLTVNSGKTLATSSYGISVTGDLTVNGTISGATAITLSGASNTVYSTTGGTISSPVILGATYTIDVASSYTLTMSGIISGTDYGISKTSAGTLILSGANTFTGGLTIKAGTVQGKTSAYAFGGSGTGTITIGDSSGSADASLTGINSLTFANPITVAAGSSGNLTIASLIYDHAYFSGAITLNNNLTIVHSASGIIDISGGITGTGNLTIQEDSTQYRGINIKTNSVNMVGTITNTGTGNQTTTISAIIGTNVTGVIQNSATSQLILSGVNTFTSGLTIKAGTVRGGNSAAFGVGTVTIGDTSGNADATLAGANYKTYTNPITVASGSTGTLKIFSVYNEIFSGAITLNNNLTLDNTLGQSLTITGGITGTGNLTITAGNYSIGLSTTSINNTGTITNSGTGTGAVTISSVIGTNVTGVIQNSATSVLNLTGANTFTTGLTIKAGMANGNAGSGGTVTIGDVSGNADATFASSITTSNPITVAAGSTGTLSIRGAWNTFSGAITLNNNLNLINAGSNSSISITGGITGTGNITINLTGSGVANLTTTSINNTGTITNSGTSTGTTTISAVIGTNVTGVIQNSSTSQLTLSGANTFTSGLAIKAGTVYGRTSANAFGANASVITLGDTSGIADAKIMVDNSLTFPNPITVASGSSGTLSIITSNGSFANVFSGAIALNNNLTIAPSTGSITLTGGITGTGNITIGSTGSSTVTILTNSVNMAGVITNSGASTGTTTISAVVGSYVTGLTQNTNTSALTLSGNNSTISGNVTISTGTLTFLGSTNVNVTGNWSNSGTFVPNQSTVVLSGTNQKIFGSNDFYNLTKDVSSGSADTLMFENTKTQTITENGTLVLKGNSGKILTLRSCDSSGIQTDGTQWGLNVNNIGTTLIVDYVDVKDSDASSGKEISQTNSTNSGNNLNWDIVSASGSGRRTTSVTYTNTPQIQTVIPPTTEETPAPKEILNPIVEQIKEATNNVAEEIKKTLSPKLPPEEPKISFPPPKEAELEKTPYSMSGKVPVLPSEKLENFVFAPLPKELLRLSNKLPKFGDILSSLNINSLSDVSKLRDYTFVIPGLKSAINLTSDSMIAVSQLTQKQKEKIPTGILFTRAGMENIDVLARLNINDEGLVSQKINVVASKKLILTLKPEYPASKVIGYIIFKSKNVSEVKKTNNLASLIETLSAMISSLPPFGVNSNQINQKTDNNSELVTQEIEYLDENNDGVYIAEINSPIVEGNYDIMTVVTYKDEKLENKIFHLLTVVDPEGYLYEKIGNKELRIDKAKVSLYWLNSDGNYELWPAKKYAQENPQITDVTGKYSFLVPEGKYYLKIDALGYSNYQSEEFDVNEGRGVHMNIELKSNNAWLTQLMDWKLITMALLVVVNLVALIYVFKNYKINNKKRNHLTAKKTK